MSSEERLVRIDKVVEDLNDGFAEQVMAIRQLVVLSAALLDAQNNLTAQIKELQEAQKHTDERLNALIDTVERVIQRGQN